MWEDWWDPKMKEPEDFDECEDGLDHIGLSRGSMKLLDGIDTPKLVDPMAQVEEASESSTRDSFTASDDWHVQSTAQILEDVRHVVEIRHPWRVPLDDSLLERQSWLEHGAHIPLPDLRVRLMEDQLSLRVRCELLDMEIPPPPPPKAKPIKKARKLPNPWYLPAHKWYSNDKLDDSEERAADFPYANMIWNMSDGPPSDEPPDARQLTQAQKENLGIVDAYKQYMKGHRLPHFLL